MESEPLSVEARARVEQRHVRQPGGTCFACGQHWPCDASQVVATIRQAEAARASLRSRLDAVEAAAQEVADVAFAVCQRQTVGTPLHKPMQALIDVLASQPEEDAGDPQTVRALLASLEVDLNHERQRVEAAERRASALVKEFSEWYCDDCGETLGSQHDGYRDDEFCESCAGGRAVLADALLAPTTPEEAGGDD